MSYNRVIIMGNLTRDPESRQSKSGTAIVKAGIAVNERMPDGDGGWKEEPSFFDVVIFGKRADAFARFMQKGSTVLLEGKLRQSRWEDRESGANRSKVEIIVDNWEFAGSKQGEASSSQPDRVADAFGGKAKGAETFDDVPF